MVALFLPLSLSLHHFSFFQSPIKEYICSPFLCTLHPSLLTLCCYDERHGHCVCRPILLRFRCLTSTTIPVHHMNCSQTRPPMTKDGSRGGSVKEREETKNRIFKLFSPSFRSVHCWYYFWHLTRPQRPDQGSRKKESVRNCCMRRVVKDVGERIVSEAQKVVPSNCWGLTTCYKLLLKNCSFFQTI